MANLSERESQILERMSQSMGDLLADERFASLGADQKRAILQKFAGGGRPSEVHKQSISISIQKFASVRSPQKCFKKFSPRFARKKKFNFIIGWRFKNFYSLEDKLA